MVSSDDDIRAMLGPILSLERLRDAVEVRSVLAVKHTKISHPATVQFRRLGIALRTRLASEREKCRKVVGGFVGTRVQAGNEEGTVGTPRYLNMQIRSRLWDRVVGNRMWLNRTDKYRQ